MTKIRELFSDARKVERTIEKVIDYYEDDPKKVDREIEEYEVTDNLELSYRKFIETYDAGVRLGDAPEVGIWVSGFYGSGKSSFTKYLGLALRGGAESTGVPIYERLAAKFKDQMLAQDLRRLATKTPSTVVFLDLARDQLIQNSAETITNVLYAKVLDSVGYSKVPKLAEVEYRLDKDGRYDAFQAAYREMFPGKGEWADIHDDPLIGPARGARLVPKFFQDDFPTAETFRTLHFQHNRTVEDAAEQVVEIIRRKRGRDQIVFVVDEVGQYVASNTQLMLNLQGLVQALKKVGRGKVWLVATAQQELDAIVDKAILNSAELFRLKDRFRPITLDASDIREITYRRLLTKSADGEARLGKLFKTNAEPLCLHTRVEGFSSGKELDLKSFRKMYPFLPVHFDVVMELIRRLARRTGGTGLRSAIRVIQDLLVDPAGSMKGVTPLAGRVVSTLATAEDIYDALRNDLAKEFPHVVEGVERVINHKRFSTNAMANRVAKAIAALQPLDSFPRTAENLAALLFPKVDAAPHTEDVREVLRELLDVRELGIVEVRTEDATDETASGTGYLFLSDRVRPFQSKRDEHRPTGGEKRQFQIDVLRQLFDPLPRTSLQNVRAIAGGLWLGSTSVAGENGDIRLVLEALDVASVPTRLDALKTETRTRSDLAATIMWLVTWPTELDEDLAEACRSAHITRSAPENEADRDVQQFLRSEKRRMERRRESAAERMRAAMLAGRFVFHGLARETIEFGTEAVSAAQRMIEEAAEKVYDRFHLAPIAQKTDLAFRFLEVERIDRMPRDRDPLKLVSSGKPAVRSQDPPLADVLREFKAKIDAAGTGRLQGSFVQDHFFAPPFGWYKDTIRYLFAALLVAGEVEFHTPDGVLKTAGPKAAEAVRNTANFNRIGIALRGTKPPLEALDRAARQLETLFGGVEVLPLEDHISRAVRSQVPPLMEKIGSLPDRLRLLDLPGENRARRVLQGCSDLVQEDAGGAASILGAPDNSLPDDISWAKGVVECLDAGGETDFRRATGLRHDLDELASNFPELAEITTSGPMRQITEALESESIFERLPSLRSGVLGLESALEKCYRRALETLRSEVASAQAEMAALPLWYRIGEEDRTQLLSMFPTVPANATVDRAQLVSELRRVLTTEAKIASIARALHTEVSKRVPKPDAPEEHVGAPQAFPARQVVRLRELLPKRDFTSRDDVDAWVTQTRERLLELIEFGHIHLTDEG